MEDLSRNEKLLDTLINGIIPPITEQNLVWGLIYRLCARKA